LVILVGAVITSPDEIGATSKVLADDKPRPYESSQIAAVLGKPTNYKL